MPSQPSVGHLLDHPAHVGADPVAVGQLGLDLGGEQVGVVLAQAVPEGLLLLGVADLHWVPPDRALRCRSGVAPAAVTGLTASAPRSVEPGSPPAGAPRVRTARRADD